MRFLALVTHLLLPVLALGVLVNGEEILNKRHHRSYNDENYSHSGDFFENNQSNPGKLVLDPSASQSTIVSSIPATAGQPLLSSVLDKKKWDRTVGEKLISTTNRTNNFNGVITKQFNGETDGSNPDEKTVAIANNGRITEFFPVTFIPSDVIHDQQVQAYSAIITNHPRPEGQENFILDGGIPPSELNDEPGSGERMSSDGQSAVETITDSISNVEASVKSNSVLITNDVSVHKGEINNRNSKPVEAVGSDSKLPGQIFDTSANTVTAWMEDLPEHNSSRGQYFEILNEGYDADDSSSRDESKNEKSSDTIDENSRRAKIENWLSVRKSIRPGQKEHLDLNKKISQSIQNGLTYSNVNHNPMNNAPTVPCPCSTLPTFSNLYLSQHLLSPLIPVPEIPPGVLIESDLPKEYQDSEIEPKSRYIEYDDIEIQIPHRSGQFLDPLVGRGVQQDGKQHTPLIHVKGDIVVHGKSHPMRLVRKCRSIPVTLKPICKHRRPVCYTPCDGCTSRCRPGRVICKDHHPLGRLRTRLVCKAIWRPISWLGIIQLVQSYDISDYELFDERDGWLGGLKENLLVLGSDESEHTILRSQILQTFETVLEPLFEVKDLVSEDEEDSTVSEQLFVEAIREAIARAPEILAPKLVGDPESEIVQAPEPVPGASQTQPDVRAANPLQDPVESKAPISNNDQTKKAADEILQLYEAEPEMLSETVIEKETRPYDETKLGNVDANGDVNVNVNFNQSVNFNGNIAARQPLLPEIQVPIISPVIKPLIHPEPGTDNGNLNTTANVDMNLNINQNHNYEVADNERLPVHSTTIVVREPDRVTNISQVERIIPVFETPSESNVDSDNVKQNDNVNINSNSNLNWNHNLNDQIEVLHQREIQVPAVNIIPQVQQPSVPEIPPKTMIERANNVVPNVNVNVEGNFIPNYENKVNPSVQIPKTPDINRMRDAVFDQNPMMLPDIVLPSIEQENQNDDLNVNSDINRNANVNTEPVIPKVVKSIPIIIPESGQMAEPLVELSTPVYEVPLLPGLPSSLNLNSNVNHNLTGNVNSQIINEANKNVIQQDQQPLTELINQPTPEATITLTGATPKLDLVHEVADAIMRGNQNVNENLNSDLNSNPIFNKFNTTRQATKMLPDIFSVSLEPVSRKTGVNVPVVNGSANGHSNIDNNIDRNVNVNGKVNMWSNHNAAVNVPRTPNGSPVIIPELRPVAELAEFALPEINPVAFLTSQVSQDHNVDSNVHVDYNLYTNNNANHRIAVPCEQLVSSVIKPVESQPVAAPKHSEILPLTPSQIDVNKKLNANAHVNKNVNVNINVDANHNVNGAVDYNISDHEIPEPPIVAKDFEWVPTSTEAPELGQVAILGSIGNTVINKNRNINANINYNPSIDVNQDSNAYENININSQRMGSMPGRVADTVSIHKSISLTSQAQAPNSPNTPIAEPGILLNGKSNGNYNVNVNVNHNSNSNVNSNRIRGQGPILFPQLPPMPWVQESPRRIIPDAGLNLIHNFDVNFNQNVSADVDHNLNLNDNHDIESREPNALLAMDDYLDNNYVPISKPDVEEPAIMDASTSVVEEKKSSVAQLTRDSQVNVNQNANANMNYNPNYNENANYNGKAVVNENENGKLPLIKPAQNALASVIVPQSQQDQGTELWNVQKNSNDNANYNSNMNYNANVNANSNYNSNLGQSGPGILAQGDGGTRENSLGIQGPIFTKTPALSTPIISNTVIGANLNSAKFGYGVEQNVNGNANFDSNLDLNLNYDTNCNHNADYNARFTNDQRNPKTKGWYELWYNNGKDKNEWTEIWNNKRFEKLFRKESHQIKPQEDGRALARNQAQASAAVR